MFDFFQFCLNSFQSCFSNKPSFHNFVSSLLGFITSPQPDTVSSLVRSLSLKPSCYDQLQKFFKQAQWDLDQINFNLIQLIQSFAPLWTVHDHVVLMGDGCKVPTDAYKFPGLSKEYMESQSASKPNGHFKALNFEELAFLGCHQDEFFPLPVWTRIVAGNEEILEWQGLQRNTQPTQIALDALKILNQIKRSILLVLDRFYLSKTLLETIREYNQSHEEKLDILIRVKKNVKVWTPHPIDPTKKKGRGRPKKKDFYSLSQAFIDYEDQFQKTLVSWNGRRVEVEFLCLDDFYWGDLENPYPLRFVLVKSPKGNSIFVTTDFNLTAQEVVETYALRFQIELSFKNQKEMFGAFSSRFTCQALENFNLKAKKGTPSPASRVKKKDRRKVIETYRAHERYAQIALVAQCICELCRVKENRDPSCRLIYQRTYGKNYSLREMKSYLGDQIKSKIWDKAENWINQILGSKITSIYHPKKMILRSRDRIREIRR